MRHDMGKCVTEKPRRGSRSAASAKARWYGKFIHNEDAESIADRIDYDGMMKLPSSRRQEGYHKKLGYKSFSDVLGPINGFIRSSVGRPWDDVYSELSAGLGQGSWPIRHVLTMHVDVATNTWEDSKGQIWSNTKYGPKLVMNEFYVDPHTGILCDSPWKRSIYWWQRVPPVTWINLTEHSHYELIDGLWYCLTYNGHDPEEVYRKIPYCLGRNEHETLPYFVRKANTVCIQTQLARARFGMIDCITIHYHDVPQYNHHDQLVKRQVGRKELRTVRYMIENFINTYGYQNYGTGRRLVRIVDGNKYVI